MTNDDQESAGAERPTWLPQSPASGLARAYAIDFICDAAGKHIKATKRRVMFRFGFSPSNRAVLEQEHVVTLSWSPTSGKAVLAADGKEVHFTGAEGASRRFSMQTKFEHKWTLASQDGEHTLRIVAHAAKPRKGPQFDVIVDGTSYFELPKCDKEGRIVGFDGDLVATSVDAQSSSGVKGTLSKMPASELKTLLNRIESKKKSADATNDNCNVAQQAHQQSPDMAAATAASSNSSVAIIPDEETESIRQEKVVAEDEVENLQRRLADLSYLPFLEMVSHEDDADLQQRGSAIVEGEVVRLKQQIMELEQVAMQTGVGGTAENPLDHANALQEIEVLKARVADLEHWVVATDAKDISNHGEMSTSAQIHDASPDNAFDLGGEGSSSAPGERKNETEATFLDFLQIMGETESELMKRDKAIAEEKASSLKNLISNLETLVDD